MAENSRKRSKLTLASDVLQSLLQNGKSPLAPGFTRFRLEQEWSEIVGEGLAKVSVPVGFQRGTLYIFVEHPSWIQQLHFMSDEIVAKVNLHLGYKFARRAIFTMDRKKIMMEA